MSKISNLGISETNAKHLSSLSDEAQVKAIVFKAQQKSKCLGIMKWCYYMTFGWILSPKHAHVNWQLTKRVWNAV